MAAGDVPTRVPVVPRHAEEPPGPCLAGEAPQHPRPHRRRGPSYQRRLLRRAAAREAAATADKAVQSVKPAEEAVVLAPPTKQVAAEVLPAHQNLWSKLRDELCPDTDYSAAAQGAPAHPPPPYLPNLSRVVSGQNIPQVDGYQDQEQELF